MDNQDKTNSSNNTGLDSFEHVVVLMLENRSFDNLLGYLYTKKDLPKGKNFQGLQDGPIGNEIPERARQGGCSSPFIYTQAAKNYNQPFPDPGEEYQHVNTQLFNTIIPDSNLNKSAAKMTQPYNLPTPQPKPEMSGFINDYINTLQVEQDHGGLPTPEQFSIIMQCFTPDSIPVLTTLAKQFAVFDNWFCSVPSQTWCNRAFWHAGTSGGQVINPITKEDLEHLDLEPAETWIKNVWDKPTLFSRLSDCDKKWRIYAPDFISLSEFIHGHKNVPLSKISHFGEFKHDIKNKKLPAYSFIEPQYLGQHNDQHPSAVNKPTRAGTVKLGEDLILDVYNTIKNSEYYSANTLLIITHDEHGGCFDHIAPPATIAPDDSIGEKGFDFKRMGVRVPMVMVSAYIEANTIVSDTFDHTSFIRTMSKKWKFAPLAARDAQANSFESVFSSKFRPGSSWPNPKAVATNSDEVENDYNDDPLNSLQQSILYATHYFVRRIHNLECDFDLLKSLDTVGKAKLHLEELRNMK